METVDKPFHAELLDVQLALLKSEIERLKRRIIERHAIGGLERERVTSELEQTAYELQRLEETWAGRIYTDAEQVKSRLREQLLNLKKQLRESERGELETIVQLERELATKLEKYVDLKQMQDSLFKG